MDHIQLLELVDENGGCCEDCTIENIDLEQQRMSVTLDDPEARSGALRSWMI